MIRFADVSFRYAASNPAEPAPAPAPWTIRNLNLTVHPGEFIALVGKNGSGKSTVARLANGLLRPEHGAVTVDGFDTRSDAVRVRDRLQLVFQTPENQQVGTTVYEDIAFGLANRGLPTREMPGRCRDALELVGLDVELDRDVNTLSGGQLQRLAIASVLALRPSYLVLDEVTAMLDPGSVLTLQETLARLRATTSLGIIQITHILDDVVDADRMVVLDHGAIRADGAPSRILLDLELLARCGLEAPYEWQGSDSVVDCALREGEPGMLSAAPQPSTATDGTPVRNRRPETPPSVELRSVFVTYQATRGRLPRRLRSHPTEIEYALESVDFLVEPGEFIAVAGRSGAGKTTLISTLKGLVRPVGGAVIAEGADVWRQRRPSALDSVGYVFQHPERQLFADTVRRDIAFGVSDDGRSSTQTRALVDSWLRRLGLDPDDIGERSPFELSGGQQRRVALAGVFITEPRTVVFDEATAGLDSPSRRALFAVVDDIRRSGVGIVWVTHRLSEIVGIADRLLIVDAGKVIAHGEPGVLLSDRALLRRLSWPLLPEFDPERRRGAARARARNGGSQ